MAKEKKKYYNCEAVIEFLGLKYKFEQKKGFPYLRNVEDFTFSWPIIIIPRLGIEKVIQNKISDIEETVLKELVMLVQIPYVLDNRPGIIVENISLGFRYDKEYKYGNINKSIAEVCYFIEQYATRTNNFYIFDNEFVFDFMSYFVIDNQWGLGSLIEISQPTEKFDNNFNRLSKENDL